MLKYAVPITAALGLAGSLGLASSTASAQSSRRPVVYAYGDDECPRQAQDSVVVCVHRPNRDRYRIDKEFRPSGDRQERQSWTRQQQAMRTVGATGTGSCSEVGPGGHTGCLLKEIQRSRAEREEAEAGDTPPGR